MTNQWKAMPKVKHKPWRHHLEKITDFDFKVGLVEEANPSDSTVWNHCCVNGNSGKDAGHTLTALMKINWTTATANDRRKELERLNVTRICYKEWKKELSWTTMEHKLAHFDYVVSEVTHQWKERECVFWKYQQHQVGATGLAMDRLHLSTQCGLSMGLLVNWKTLMIIRSLYETQIIRSWRFVVREAPWRSTNRSESAFPQLCWYWETTRM